MDPVAFWQDFSPGRAPPAPFADAFPASLSDQLWLALPIRPLPGTQTALASLIINQASFAVQRELARRLAASLAPVRPEVVVGLPTLGLTVAAAVAAELGHTRYVALGTSRKFWYDDALSAPVSSVTSPDDKRLYLDPRLLPLLAGRRVALVDDVISTGRSVTAGLRLLQAARVAPVAIGALMLQTGRWRPALGTHSGLVAAVFESPLLERDGAGWRPAAED